ncbi:MAG: S41 family peptidase [Bryobacteraceae bacterium]
MLAPLLFLFATAPASDVEQLLKQFVDVLVIAKREAADPVNTEQAIYQGAIPGMLRRLDPHSVFFDPAQYEQLKQMEHSEQKGFGSVLSILPGRVIVLQAVPGTPSAKAGLSPGDEILAVNNVALNRLDMDQLIGFLGQARQQTAHLDVRRPGNARLLQFNLNPELVDSPSVDRWFLLRPGIGYVRVASFDPQTGRQLKQAIEKLGGNRLTGLVIDLRNNLGGVVQAAMESASLFLKPGQRILTVRGRTAKSEDVDVPKTATPYSFPVAVLVNEKTASASEILAGALQDHDRAVILGIPSYGKGLVQRVRPLSNNTALALTIAFYYTPSGRSIQKPLRAGQLAVQLSSEKYRTDSGRAVTGGGGIEPDVFTPPEQPARLRIVLDASGILTNFATEFTHNNQVTGDFQMTPAILDEFQVFAAEHNIQPAISDWIREREWVQSRLQQEILNQGVGIEKGDEVEARRDPAVRRAIEEITRKLAARLVANGRAWPESGLEARRRLRSGSLPFRS